MPPLRLTCTFLLASLSLMPCLAQHPAHNADAVRALIASCDGGQLPLVWYETSPQTNSGRGGAALVLNSGGAPSGRGLDPWGRLDSAFGPTASNGGGAAISGSTAASLIRSRSGGVLMFFMPPRDLIPPAILFSRADWAERHYLGLRLQKADKNPQGLVTSLGYADPVTGKSSQIHLTPVSRGYWMFAAITWRESGDRTFLTHWTGSLGSGILNRGEVLIPSIEEGSVAISVGGRKPGQDYPSPKLALADGFICNFAITESELSAEVVEAIFQTAIRR